MEITSVNELFVFVLAVLTWLIAFVKAIMLPVLPAGIIIGFVVDHLFKRLPFWKDGWAGYASVGLNVLVSAGLFFASQVDKSEEYLAVIVQLGTLLTLIVAASAGAVVSFKTHTKALELGIGKSVTQERFEKEDDDWWESMEEEKPEPPIAPFQGLEQAIFTGKASSEDVATEDPVGDGPSV